MLRLPSLNIFRLAITASIVGVLAVVSALRQSRRAIAVLVLLEGGILGALIALLA